MERKLTSIGNSLGVTLPAEILEKASLEKGDSVTIELIDGKIVLSKKTVIELPNGVNSDFFEGVKYLLDNHGEALKGLVDR